MHTLAAQNILKLIKKRINGERSQPSPEQSSRCLKSERVRVDFLTDNATAQKDTAINSNNNKTACRPEKRCATSKSFQRNALPLALAKTFF